MIRPILLIRLLTFGFSVGLLTTLLTLPLTGTRFVLLATLFGVTVMTLIATFIEEKP